MLTRPTKTALIVAGLVAASVAVGVFVRSTPEMPTDRWGWLDGPERLTRAAQCDTEQEAVYVRHYHHAVVALAERRGVADRPEFNRLIDESSRLGDQIRDWCAETLQLAQDGNFSDAQRGLETIDAKILDWEALIRRAADQIPSEDIQGN